MGKSLTHFVKAVIMVGRVPKGAVFCMEIRVGWDPKRKAGIQNGKTMESDCDGGQK